MYEDKDHEFFDRLYQLWSKTTGAENHYWMPEEDTNYYAGGPGTWNLVAVDAQNPDWKWDVADHLTEEDADFIAGLHGAIPDLIRRLHEAIDEVVRKDEQNDIAQGQLAEALLENIGLRNEILEIEKQVADLQWRLDGLEK